MIGARWLSPTGGLGYHWRAARFRNTLWSEFRARLGKWLRAWNPPERMLVLIGPSAGYCLDAEFLAQFDSLHAIDPDPLARMIFPRRFQVPGKISWDTTDYMAPVGGRFDPSLIAQALEVHGASAVLFCNFLGQMHFLDDQGQFESSFAEWKAALTDTLTQRGASWASFHDRLSGSVAPTLSPHEEATSPTLLRDSELLARFYPCSREGVELTDHWTGDLFPRSSRTYLSWELVPGSWHLIEAVSYQNEKWGSGPTS